jgi:integrase
MFVCSQYFDEHLKLKVVGATVDKRMLAITYAYRLRGRFGVLTRLQIPLGDMRGLTWGGEAKKKGAKDPKSIPAVPDGIFNPLMVEALRWVDVYSADISQLLHIHDMASRGPVAWNSNNYSESVNKALVGFKFSNSPVTHQPWRPEIQDYEVVDEESEEGTTRRRLTPLTILRRLATSLLAACSIVVQGLTGVRISELMGLTEEPDSEGALPSCIEVRPSIEGLNDVFMMKGPITKGTGSDNKLEVQWVVGIRPVGTDVLPEVVRAIQVILEITEFWRGFTTDTNVLIGSRGHGLPRSQGGAGSMTSNTMRALQRLFLAEWVDLPIHLAGWRLTSHQFRKKFAQDIVRCDPNAIPAVREHFKHMSMHILETGYLGNDMELLGLINHQALRDASAQIMAILDGEPTAGKMADDIRRKSSKLQSVLRKCETHEERASTLERLIGSEGVLAWPCDWGTCLFRAETALCHLAGRGSYDTAAIRPLPSERCADRCCNCSNLVVSARNVGFWKDRYRSNERLKRIYRDEGNTAWALLASTRAKASAAILHSHGIDAGELNIAA